MNESHNSYEVCVLYFVLYVISIILVDIAVRVRSSDVQLVKTRYNFLNRKHVVLKIKCNKLMAKKT